MTIVQVLEIFLRQIFCVEGVIQPGLCFVCFSIASSILLMNAALYRRRAHASAIIAFAARELFLI